MKNCITLLLVSLFSLLTNAQTIERVDPPFWWADMKHQSLQLMVYGEGIGALNARVEHPGVTLADSHQVDSPNYLFLDLTLSDDFKGGTVPIHFTGTGGRSILYEYAFHTRRKASALREGFNNTDAIYLITPDRFANGNPENDSVPDMKEKADRGSSVGRHGGDLAGILNHLDYIAGMGFTAIWPTPVLENNQPEYSYHGYATTDHYRIDPRFGRNSDYRALSLEGRAKGVGLIQDIILNHIGSEHWWMKDLPTEDWLNYPNEFQPTTHYRTSVQDPYAAEVDKREFANGWFVRSMPDLNQNNPLVANYLIQNSIWWIEYADLYGIRTDTYSYSDKQFLTDWTRRIMTEYPHFNIVGEEWSTNPNVVSYWQRGKNSPDGYVSHLPSVMDFPVYDSLRTALTQEEAWNRGFIHLYETLADDTAYPSPMDLVIFAENHDTSRLFSLLDEDLNRFNIAMTVLATMRGTPQFFYGSEVLATSPKTRDDGAVRSDFPGGWAGDLRNGFTGEGLAPEQSHAQTYLRKLLNWRRDSPVIHEGNLLHFAPYNGVYVYFRFTESERVMVAINHTDSAATLPVARYREGLGDATTATDVISGQSHAIADTISLKAMHAHVFELN